LSFEPESDLNPEPEPGPGPKAGRKFYLALSCYAAIAALAGLTLDGKFLWMVWIILGGLALKTYIGTLKTP
jgi:hypothetical protein